MVRKLVSVVDDDESVREALPALLESFDLEVLSFASAEEFLASDELDRIACVILDISLPGMAGPELRRHLIKMGADIATIFITAHCEEAASLMARDQAVCLIKPFGETALLTAVRAALGEEEGMA